MRVKILRDLDKLGLEFRAGQTVTLPRSLAEDLIYNKLAVQV